MNPFIFQLKKFAIVIILGLMPVSLAASEQTDSPVTNVLLWPTMNYANFMAGHPNEARREQMWNYFLPVEREAKHFAGTPDRWKMLKSVTLGKTGPKWFSSGRLQLGAKSAEGTMFHEIFHNAFNGSRFHEGEDNAWAEAFCDAFRYMMEKKYLPNPRTKWFLKMDGYCNESFEQVMSQSGDKAFDRRYCYPASLIVRKADKDPEKFRVLWFELQQWRQMKNANVLDAYFNYDMEKEIGRNRTATDEPKSME